MNQIPCPFIDANGRTCPRHVERIEAYKADLNWTLKPDGSWYFRFGPRSHYHVLCSEKGNHAGFRRQDSPNMKFWFDTLPTDIRDILEQTNPPKPPPNHPGE